MNLRGNPFVDVGLAIAAQMSGHTSISNVSATNVSDAARALRSNIEDLKSLRVLSAFWVNNPFMGKNSGQKDKFDQYLKDLGDQRLPTWSGYCQICGQSPVIGQTDRCWFPLAASGDSDPCTLPSLRGKTICAVCLSAAVVLPLGCCFCREGPYFIHVGDPDLQVEAVSEGVRVIRESLARKVLEPPKHGTSLSGRLALLEIVSGSTLWDHSQPGHMTRIPQGGATIISFNNKGNGPSFNELRLPAQALEFFGAILEAGVQGVFLRWVQWGQRIARESKRKDYIDQLCDGVEMRRSLGPLLFSVVKDRAKARLGQEEKQVLQIYEDIALNKKERFDALERIASRIKAMPERYSDSFIKQLGNTRTKGSFLELVKRFCKSERLTMSSNDLRVIDYGPANEVIALLYLLCVAED